MFTYLTKLAFVGLVTVSAEGETILSVTGSGWKH